MPLDTFDQLSIPIDANAKTPAVVFGYDPATDVFYPLSVEDMGNGTFRLKVLAELTGGITIGSVTLKDGVSPTLASILDGKLLSYIDDNPLNKKNIKAEYTYKAGAPGLGKVETVKEYLSSAGVGDPAKLTTFTYNVDDKIQTVTVTDTTV